MADKDGTPQPLPGAFADAPEPTPVVSTPAASGSDNGTGDTSDKKPAQSEKGLKSSGVPKARLLGWAVPVLGVVAGVAMYHESPMGAAVMFAVAFLILLIAGVMHLKGRGGKSSSSGGGGRSARQSRPRGQRRMPWSRSGGRGGRSGGASGSSRGASGGPSGARQGIRGRFSRNRGGSAGRTGGGTGGAGDSSAGRTGPSTAKGKSGEKRNWNPFRRNRADSSPKSTTGANGSSGTSASGATGSPNGKRSMFPWRRNKATSGTDRGHSGSSTTAGTPGAKTNAGRDGTRPRQTSRNPFNQQNRWNRKNLDGAYSTDPNGKDLKGNPTKPMPSRPRTRRERLMACVRGPRGQKDTGTPGDKAGTGSQGGQAASSAKPDKQPRWRPWRRRTSWGDNSQATAGDKPRTTRPEGRSARARRKEAEKNQPVLDDAGFPLVDISKPKPAKKPTRDDPIPVDDGGFPTYTPPPTKTPAQKTPARHTKERKVDTTPWLSEIDQSTPQTTQASMLVVAEAARRNADSLQEEVDQMRRDAGAMGDKPGMVEAAEELNREAAAKELVVESRKGVAAAFENKASQINVAA